MIISCLLAVLCQLRIRLEQRAFKSACACAAGTALFLYILIFFQMLLRLFIQPLPPSVCATSRTVPGSIPGGVTWDFFRGSFQQNHVP